MSTLVGPRIREQWDDGVDYLAVAPGVIMGYERNVATSMTCPIERDPA